jgi:hypothetical protein
MAKIRGACSFCVVGRSQTNARSGRLLMVDAHFRKDTGHEQLLAKTENRLKLLTILDSLRVPTIQATYIRVAAWSQETKKRRPQRA